MRQNKPLSSHSVAEIHNRSDVTSDFILTLSSCGTKPGIHLHWTCKSPGFENQFP